MNEEELEEIENTLKLTKPYNELGSYNYFNCESIEKLLNQNKQLQQELTDYKEELAKADSMLQSEIFYGEELSSRQLLNMLKDYKERNEKATIKVSELMSKYFYEKDFCIEDTHLDELLQILDKKEGK